MRDKDKSTHIEEEESKEMDAHTLLSPATETVNHNDITSASATSTPSKSLREIYNSNQAKKKL